jgi:hypothetical protein
LLGEPELLSLSLNLSLTLTWKTLRRRAVGEPQLLIVTRVVLFHALVRSRGLPTRPCRLHSNRVKVRARVRVRGRVRGGLRLRVRLKVRVRVRVRVRLRSARRR